LFQKKNCQKYTTYGRLIAVAIKDERLYKMKSYMNEEKLQANMSKSNMTIKEKLHRTLGYINFNNLEIMCKIESLDGLPKRIEPEYLKCATCIQNKMHNLPFHNNRRRAENILKIVHTFKWAILNYRISWRKIFFEFYR